MTAQTNDLSVPTVDHVRSAFEILAEGAASVAASLVNVAVNGKSEIARVQAAQAVLDRVGLPAKVDVGITATQLIGVVSDTSGGVPTSQTVMERLANMRAAQLAAKAQAALAAQEDGTNVVQFPTIIHGEVDQ